MSTGSKPIWKSKTHGLGVLLVLAEFHPGLKAWIGSHPQTALMGSAAAYTLLRHFTDCAIHFRKPAEPSFEKHFEVKS